MADEKIEVGTMGEDLDLKKAFSEIMDANPEEMTEREISLLPMAIAEIWNVHLISSGTNSLSVTEMKDTLNELTSLQTSMTDREAFMEILASGLLRNMMKELMTFGYDVPEIAERFGYDILTIGRQKSGEDHVDIDIFNKIHSLLKECKSGENVSPNEE